YRKVGEDDDKALLHNWWDAFIKGQVYCRIESAVLKFQLENGSTTHKDSRQCLASTNYLDNDGVAKLICTIPWHSINRKRSASAVETDSPEGPTMKRPRLDTIPGIKLAKLQQLVSQFSQQSNDWEKFAPDGFIKEMTLRYNQIMGLTAETVEEFIKGGGLEQCNNALRYYGDKLRNPFVPTSLEDKERGQEAYEQMDKYVNDFVSLLTDERALWQSFPVSQPDSSSDECNAFSIGRRHRPTTFNGQRFVRGTPASGKSTLAQLLALHIKNIEGVNPI
ncbi:5047_t:CDS:2, partial [Acaulospora colombiana]